LDAAEADIPMGNVNQGGNSTMLGHWRVVLKQAEESAKAGRLDEALALAARADVADHRQAVQLRGKYTLELVKRAGRRAEADDLDGALGDLDAAESFGAAPDVLASSRSKLADLVAEDLRTDLAAGEPDRVVDRVDAMGKRKVASPGLRRLRESAEAWKAARLEARRGEFGVAAELLDRASRLAGDGASDALLAARRELEARPLLPDPLRLPRRLAGDPRRGRGPAGDRPRPPRRPPGPQPGLAADRRHRPRGPDPAEPPLLSRQRRDPVPRRLDPESESESDPESDPPAPIGPADDRPAEVEARRPPRPVPALGRRDRRLSRLPG
jgi:hypothetical protein